MKIFWSWQSDTHQPSNRYFVRDVLNEVAKSLNGLDGAEESNRPESNGEEDDIDEGAEPADDFVSIDHDTKGLGGSVRIAERILEKIATAAIFVADITPVAKTLAGKHVPNPNVMIELGYALRVLDEDQIVLVGNQSFDAKLARLPFDLRHRSAPAFYKLTADTPDERKVVIAAELMENLRDRIEPGLKLALKKLREDARRTKRAPELAVIVERDSDEPLVITQSARLVGVKTLEEIRAEHPPLRPRRLGVGAARGLVATPSRVSLGMHGRERGPEQWTVEEIEAYNRRLQHFYTCYEAFLAAREEHSKALLRTFQIQLAIENSGTAPATEIDVDIYFPNFVVLREHDEAPPVAPEPPEPPAKIIVDGNEGYGRVMAIRQPFAELVSPHLYTRHSTLIYPADGRVHFSEGVLKHNHLVSLEPVIVSLATEQDVASFEADYVITANEPIDPIRGTVSFDIRLAGGEVTT